MEDAISAVTNFRKLLALELSPQGIAVRRWADATKISDHILELDNTPKRTVLYVKESNLPRRLFWGLTRNQLERMRAGHAPWFVVLLANSSNSGYALSAGQVDAEIRGGA